MRSFSLLLVAGASLVALPLFATPTLTTSTTRPTSLPPVITVPPTGIKLPKNFKTPTNGAIHVGRPLPRPKHWATIAIVARPTSTGSAPAPTSTSTSTSSSGGPPPPPTGTLPTSKPANGNVGSLSVPDGSFAEDDPQKLQVTGTGGCTLDLAISNKTYGGSFDKTFSVGPLNLANGPFMLNGKDFDTLAQGSYHATATGKAGCTGSAPIDFKVTEKQSTASIKGQPTITLAEKPVAGTAYSRSKDSNIWFKVSVPSVFADKNASCCEIEWDFQNSYGGWEALPSSPYGDSAFNPLANGNNPAPMSVSGFTVPNEGATHWRVRMRGFYFKTTFDWSDWLEFQVDQN